MRCVWFEPTIPASEPAKTVHALDRSATVTGIQDDYNSKRKVPEGVAIYIGPKNIFVPKQLQK
jgi:hypothetical protein